MFAYVCVRACFFVTDVHAQIHGSAWAARKHQYKCSTFLSPTHHHTHSHMHMRTSAHALTEDPPTCPCPPGPRSLSPYTCAHTPCPHPRPHPQPPALPSLFPATTFRPGLLPFLLPHPPACLPACLPHPPGPGWLAMWPHANGCRSSSAASAHAPQPLACTMLPSSPGVYAQV